MQFLQKIQNQLEDLSPAERSVAALLLQDPAGFVHNSVQVLAKGSGVSGPSVLRFCRRMGFVGLSDFKLALAASSQGTPFIHPRVARGDAPSELVEKIAQGSAALLAAYSKACDTEAIEMATQRLVRSIQSGGRIDFYGFGNSAIVALDAQHKFFRLGAHSQAYADAHVQVMAASLLGPTDCVVLISNSGTSQDLLHIADLAKSKGAASLAISLSRSQLSRKVDHFLAADHDEAFDNYSPMSSRLLHLLIIDILTTGVALALGQGILPQLAQMKRDLKGKK
jgi:RpiR family transcriptional regulator, carbohydrate utilization regulator